MLQHPLARALAASMAMFLALALSLALTEAVLPKDTRVAWPNLVAAFACALGYWAYANRVEQRAVTELSSPGAWAEWTRGAGLGVLVTAAASLAFTAAYQLSRRLWLPIGMHFAWNYLFSAVFSVPVSGHEAQGWLQGSMSGSSWLSGGVYGVEASAAALLVWAVTAGLMLRRAYARGQFIPRLHLAS